MSTDTFAYDVFLSHNSADKPRVRKLAERLRDAGLQVWFDEWVIEIGSDIYLTVEQGLEESRTLILCMSAAAFGSDWVDLERSTSLFRDPRNKTRRFVPLLLEDCKVRDALRRYKYVDFRHDSPEAFDQLLKACRIGAGTPIARPVSESASQSVSPPQQQIADRPQRDEKVSPIATPHSPIHTVVSWVTIPAGEFLMGAQKVVSQEPNYDPCLGSGFKWNFRG